MSSPCWENWQQTTSGSFIRLGGRSEFYVVEEWIRIRRPYKSHKLVIVGSTPTSATKFGVGGCETVKRGRVMILPSEQQTCNVHPTMYAVKQLRDC
jgi:hypothetical protein